MLGRHKTPSIMITGACASVRVTAPVPAQGTMLQIVRCWLSPDNRLQQGTGHKIIFIDVHWNNWVFVIYLISIHPQSRCKSYLPWLGKFYPYISTRKAHWVWQWSERRLCDVWSVMKLEIMNVMNEELLRSDMSRSHASLGAKNNATAGTESFIELR